MLIYKIFRADEWSAFRAAGETRGAPIDLQDGYIHFSTAAQVTETAAKHFAGAEGLMLLALEADTLGDTLIWEPSRGGALFPHLYRPMRLTEVHWAHPLPLVDGVHQFPEGVTNGHVDPTRAQFEAFKGLDRDHPIEMLNLVRLRDLACYPEGHALAQDGLTGAAAYARYGAESGPVLARVGGTILWRGGYETMLIGPESEVWDHVFVARYPTTHAFLQMVTDPEYQRAVVHRQAGVVTSRLIRCAPADAGLSFG
ncbi:MAG: DUF952 domain-containing protein [Aestuariivita sp.]|jgi:uncharacterized protein (DUF952 family)/uncharacterized protein (DUF1330 family)|nr:DUF952 domain-containing protein [Aestuariivita sp.]